MPNYERFQNGQVVETVVLTPEQEAAEVDADKERQLGVLDLVAFRSLFNHENRMRAIARTIRSISATANTAANTQGMEAARPDMTLAEFRQAIKALL